MVIDASWWLAYLLPDETEQVNLIEMDEMVRVAQVRFIAPGLLRFEIGNAIRMNIVRKRLEMGLGLVLYKKFSQLKIKYQEVDIPATLQLAVENKLTVYDAAYMWLAIEEKAELLTLDEKMKQVWQKLRKS